MLDLKPLLPTHRYRIELIDGARIDVDAEGMWPTATTLEWWITVSVIGLPRLVCAQRCRTSEVVNVERDDGH
ncbi:MAG: hypothetical protein ACR2KL_04395, partial [Nocardioidaceae bacterium]